MIFQFRPIASSSRARAARGLLGAWLVLMSGCENLDREQLGISKGPAFDKNAESKEAFYTPLREPIETTPCLLYTSPSPRDRTRSRMPSSA